MRVAAPILGAALLLAACGSDDGDTEEPTAEEPAEEPEEPDDGTVAPLASGFPEETITLLVIDDAGSADGIMARAVQQAFQRISPVQINIVDRPDFGRFGNYEAAQWMADQPGGDEGYIVAVIVEPGGTSDLIAEPVIAELGASFDTFNHVIAVEQTPYGLYTATDRPWGNDIEAFIEYGRENPGELRYLGGGGGSGRDISVADYMDRLDIEYTEIAGGSFTEIAAAIAAGEADFAIVSTEVVGQFLEDGRIEVLAITQDGPPIPGMEHAPRMKEVTGQDVDPWGRTTGFFVSENTPQEHRDWLFEALRLVTEDPAFIESREAIAGNTVVALGHDEFREVAVEGYFAAYPILERIGLVDPTVTGPLPRP